MARVCLFCDNPAGSGEHLFADWLNELFPMKLEVPVSQWARQVANADQIKLTTWGAAQIAGETTNLVCHDCNTGHDSNTGWMSVLEYRAKPVLAPMIRGEVSTLTVEQQFLVTTWAVKTAMVIEPTLSPLDNFSQEDRAIVRTQLRPPGHVEIVLAAVEGDIPPLSYACARVHVTANDGRAPRDVHFYTLQVGALVMQILRWEPPCPNYGALGRMDIPDEIRLAPGVAVRVFPPDPDLRSIEWPDGGTLNWDGVVDFAQRGLDMPDDWVPPLQIGTGN